MAWFSRSPSQFQCPRCGKINVLPACSNCNGVRMHRGPLSNGTMGIFCKDCNVGFTWVSCTDCGTQLPAEKFA